MTEALALPRIDFSYNQRVRLSEPEILSRPDFLRSEECGNYLEHDLQGAAQEAKSFLPVIENWNSEKLKYQS